MREKQLIQQHIHEQGSLKMNSHKMLLCGLPRTGKTTTTLRLSNQLLCLDPNDSPRPSTGFEKPRTVELQSVMIAEGEGKVEWKYQALEQQIQTLFSCILNSRSSSTSSPAVTSSSSRSDVANRSSAGELTARIEDVLPSPSSTVHDELPADLINLVEAREWKEVREKLKVIEDVTILHMMDCGGHPECNEVLPLLLEGRALSLIFLNLNCNLEKTYPVVFQGEKGCTSAEHESELTAMEVLQDILRSISSLQSGAHMERPVALLIGTHLDKTTHETVSALEKSIHISSHCGISQRCLFTGSSGCGQ